jgi:hypothetical protein
VLHGPGLDVYVADVPSDDQLKRLLAATAHSGDGRTLGPVTGVYLDGDEQPAWVAVRPGPLGTAERLVPLALSRLEPGGRLVVTVRRRALELAPAAPPGDLGLTDEDALYRFYAYAISPIVPWDHLTRIRPEFDGIVHGPVRLRRHRLSAPERPEKVL